MGALAFAAPSLGAQEIDAPPSCGSKVAAFSDGKTFRLWMVRRGSLVVNDPLRPLSRDTMLVLQIIVNGRVATAYGPDLSQLRRGGPPATLEEQNGESIRWEGGNDAPPPVLRIVADDGRVVFDRLAFSGCEDAPAVRSPSRARPDTPAPAPRAGSRPPKPPVALPQGAIR